MIEDGISKDVIIQQRNNTIFMMTLVINNHQTQINSLNDMCKIKDDIIKSLENHLKLLEERYNNQIKLFEETIKSKEELCDMYEKHIESLKNNLSEN